jgi:tetratricopeptide (TPR) repeat protein
VLASNRGDWTSAAELLDQAVTLDPEMAFYWLQSGYAHGQLALDENGMVQDSGEAKLATEAYERGLAIEPNYATNWANLGVLYWALGDRSGAIEDLTLAVELAPREASFRLTLGRMHEADNQLEQAKADYLEALSQRPHWAYSEFFRKTEFRERLITDWIAQYPYAHHPGGQELLEGWMAFDQGRYAHARAFFEDAIGVNTTEAYLGLGMSNLRLGNFEAAKLALLKAKTVPHLSGWVRVQTSLTLGSIEKAVGNYTQAILHFESALETLRATTSLGIGRMGNSDYGWYIFYRSSIAADLLPGIDYLLYTDQVIKGMLELAECYLIEGDRESVKRIYTDVIEISPEYPFEESWLKEIES